MSSAVSDSPAPYLASIGLLSSGDSGAPATNVAGQIGAHSDTDALQSLHLQCGRMMEAHQLATTRALEERDAEINELHGRAGSALARVDEERAALERMHASEMETQRQATAVTLRSLHAELAALRELHVRELEAVRRAADEEHTRLKEWCAAQLRAVADNRDAIVEHLAGQREGTAEASVAQLAKVEAEHREQQADLRKLLQEESERCAAARAEVISVSIAAGNERIALQTALATARRRSAAATADSSREVNAAKDAALAREGELRKALHAAQRKCEVQAAASARAVAEAARRAEDAASRLRHENDTLRESLDAAHAAAAKANARAHRAHARAAELSEKLRAAEERAARRAPKSMAMGRVHHAWR